MADKTARVTPLQGQERDITWINEMRDLTQLDQDDKTFEKMSRLESLLERVSFMRDLRTDDPKEYRKYLSQLTIVDCNPRDVLTEIGSYATELYVVLSGSVEVLAKPAKKEGGQLFLARTLYAGDSFNEISLLTKAKSLVQYVASANATATTTKTELPNPTTVLLCFNQSLVSKILSQLNVQVDMHLSYLKNLPVLWNLTQRNLHLIFLLASPKRVLQNDPLFLEGEPANTVFIIKQGEFSFYKYFSALQQRKSKDSSSTKSIERMSGSSLKLSSFEKSKNLKNRTFNVNEIAGEEDVIGRTTRSFSMICESENGLVLCLSQMTFKQILMNFDGVSNFIFTKLRIKQEEITRFLDEQATQVSSARIGVLERDMIRVSMTQDYVKSRSYLASHLPNTNSNLLLPNITSQSSSNNNINTTPATSNSNLSNARLTHKLATSQSQNPNSFNIHRTATLNLQADKNNGTDTPTSRTSQVKLQQQQQQQQQSETQTTRFALSPQTQQPQQQQHYLQGPSQPPHKQVLLMSAGKLSMQAIPIQRILTVPNEHSPTEKGDSLSSSSPSARGQHLLQPLSQHRLLDDLSTSNRSQFFKSATNNLNNMSSKSKLFKESEENNQKSLSPSYPRHDSLHFFSNFTRNSQQYMQKFQNIMEQRINNNPSSLSSAGGFNSPSSLLGGSNSSSAAILLPASHRSKHANNEELDKKSRQLSQLIQDELNKLTPPSSRLNQPQVIYKKPITDQQYQKLEESAEKERIKAEQPNVRQFKINFYQSKN